MNLLREVDLMPRMFPPSVLHVMSSEQLDEGFQRGQQKPIEKPLTKKEAANYMRVGVKCFDKWFRENKLPASLRHYVGGTILYYASELEIFVRKS